MPWTILDGCIFIWDNSSFLLRVPSHKKSLTKILAQVTPSNPAQHLLLTKIDFFTKLVTKTKFQVISNRIAANFREFEYSNIFSIKFDMLIPKYQTF